MAVFLIETILYFIMAALIRQLTQIKGLWPALAFFVVFTIITQLPGEWITLPLLFGALLLPCLIQWQVPLYFAIGLTVVPTIGCAYLLHHYAASAITLGGMGVPAGLTSGMPGLLGQ